MNEKFFQLAEEKQLKIINAAYKVFAFNSYKKAPTSEIAEEGNISKALLFHYFKNKLGLYQYLWEYAKEKTEESIKEHKVYENEDFFEMLRRGLKSKCDLMRAYPYMALFSINAFYEEEPAVKSYIQKSVENATDSAFQTIVPTANLKNIRTDVSFESIFREILYSSEGMMNRWYQKKEMDVDVFEKEYLEMIRHWETVYLNRSPSSE